MNVSLAYGDNVTNGGVTDAIYANATIDNITDIPPFNDVDNQSIAFKVNLMQYVTSVDIIAFLGILGNIMLIVVMTSPKLRHQPYVIYMVFLAVSDSLVLSTIAMEDSLDHIFHLLNALFTSHVLVCKSWLAASIVFRMVSPWLLVAMTFDRYIAVVFPFQKSRICNQKYALIACLCICMTGLCLVAPIFYYVEHLPLGNGGIECGTYNFNLIYFYMTTSTLVDSVLPVCALSVLNIHTAVVLRRASASMLRRTKSEHSLTETNFLKITTSLLLVSALSGLALVPFAINTLYEFVLELTRSDPGTLELLNQVWLVLNTVRLLNYGMNFYVLVIFFDQYRYILRDRLTCAKRVQKPRETTQTVTSSSTLDGKREITVSCDISTVGL